MDEQLMAANVADRQRAAERQRRARAVVPDRPAAPFRRRTRLAPRPARSGVAAAQPLAHATDSGTDRTHPPHPRHPPHRPHQPHAPPTWPSTHDHL